MSVPCLKTAFLITSVFLGSMLCCETDAAQGRDAIRFETSLSVKLEKLDPPPSLNSALEVVVLVSAHAVGSNFTGERTIGIRFFKLGEPTDYQTIWAEALCHQDRGYPYIAIKKITGRIEGAAGSQIIDAQPRIIGKPLPPDEIASDSRKRSPLMDTSISDRVGDIKSWSFRTRQSQIRLDIRLVRTKC